MLLTLILFIFSGCKTKSNFNYNDNKSIATDDGHYNAQLSSVSHLDDNRVKGEFGQFNGFEKVLECNVYKETEATLHISITANAGKGKLVLVKPNSEVEVLKEAIYGKNDTTEGDITVHCITGINQIKIVGENYKGNFEISQKEKVLFTRGNEEDSMFGENFPFGDKHYDTLNKTFPFDK